MAVHVIILDIYGPSLAPRDTGLRGVRFDGLVARFEFVGLLAARNVQRERGLMRWANFFGGVKFYGRPYASDGTRYLFTYYYFAPMAGPYRAIIDRERPEYDDFVRVASQYHIEIGADND